MAGISSKRRPAVWAVVCFAGAAAVLAPGIERARVAEAYTDPVGHIRAQDESVYANSALTLATRGGWLTPKFLGRFLLFKPPLLVWMAGLSLRLLGISLAALRLPVLLAGALGAAVVFLWSARMRSATAGVLAALLLVADPLWHLLSRICYTDMLLASSMVVALYGLARDPQLRRRGSLLLFAGGCAAGVMAKNVAGLLPMVVLAAAAAVLPAEGRPSLRRVAQAAGIVALLAGPWHLYQAIAHPQWFWMDYVRIQLLGFGLHPPAQHAAEGQALFYARRLLLLDPLLCVLALAALPALAADVRARKPGAVLLAAWVAVAAAATLAFRYRNLPYLLYLLPALCLAAANYGPLAAPSRRRAMALAAVVFLCFLKPAFPGSPWGLRYGPQDPQPSATALRRYADLSRSNELIDVDPDDDFYASTLALPRLRYCFIDPQGVGLQYAPHFAHLGIILSPAQFLDLKRLEPRFRANLRAWGLDSAEPIGSAIAAKSPADAAAVIRGRPDADFYLPETFRPLVTGDPSHTALEGAPGRFFLLSRVPTARRYPRPGWRVPAAW